jgi:hypothetical protein
MIPSDTASITNQNNMVLFSRDPGPTNHGKLKIPYVSTFAQMSMKIRAVIHLFHLRRRSRADWLSEMTETYDQDIVSLSIVLR